MEFFRDRWCSWRVIGSGAKERRKREEEEVEDDDEDDVKEEEEEEEEEAVVVVVVERIEDRGTERAMIRRDRAGSTCSSRYRAWINTSL